MSGSRSLYERRAEAAGPPPFVRESGRWAQSGEPDHGEGSGKFTTRRVVARRRETLAMATHYAQAFTLCPGRCFRMVTDPRAA
jgi:hypothetical protein